MPDVPNQTPAVSESLLDPKEKAKLDYQLKLDKERMAIERCNKLKEVALDKLIFGAVVALIGAWLYSQVNHSLEEFKMDEARQRFFLEKRTEAIFDMEVAMSDVAHVYFSHVGDKKDAPETVVAKEYETALANATKAINRSQWLFSPEFNANVDKYFEVHHAISLLGPKNCAAYHDFIAELTNAYDELCQAAIFKRVLVPMPLGDISASERKRMMDSKPKDYLDAHFVYWRDHKK